MRIALVSLLAAAAAAAQPTTIDFDDIPGTEQVSWAGTRYAHEGVVFGVIEPAVSAGLWSTGDPPEAADTLPRWVYGALHLGGTSPNGGIFIEFMVGDRTGATAAASFWVADVDDGRGEWRAEAYDIYGVLLEQRTGTEVKTLVRFFRPQPDIHRIEFHPSADGEGIDTVIFDGIFLAIDCYGDFNQDGTLDIFDFLAFQNAFAMGDPAADCDHSGRLDLFDFLCFQSAFAAGCP
ncbi:MAG: GC-type dockerin domain-anchored protein [Phycisphaerales bacterium JB039]